MESPDCRNSWSLSEGAEVAGAPVQSCSFSEPALQRAGAGVRGAVCCLECASARAKSPAAATSRSCNELGCLLVGAPEDGAALPAQLQSGRRRQGCPQREVRSCCQRGAGLSLRVKSTPALLRAAVLTGMPVAPYQNNKVHVGVPRLCSGSESVRAFAAGRWNKARAC